MLELQILLMLGLLLGVYVVFRRKFQRWSNVDWFSYKGREIHVKLREGSEILGVILEVDTFLFRSSLVIKDELGLKYFVFINSIDWYKI